MGNSYSDIKERIAEIASLRDRTNKKPLSFDERFQLLNEIYDGLLYLWKQQIIAGQARGTSAVAHQLERARLEMTDLGRTHGKTGSGTQCEPGVVFDLQKYRDDLRDHG